MYFFLVGAGIFSGTQAALQWDKSSLTSVESTPGGEQLWSWQVGFFTRISPVPLVYENVATYFCSPALCNLSRIKCIYVAFRCKTVYMYTSIIYMYCTVGCAFVSRVVSFSCLQDI